MPVKIRLQRKGRKKQPIYHIVIADSRAPRDGRYIENIGLYDPKKNPAIINLDFDAALSWLQKGAQPTETCKAILSYKGVLYKNHLLNGVKKGAFDETEAEKRYNAWISDKEANILSQKQKIAKDLKDQQEKLMKAEQEINEIRAKKLAERLAKETASEQAAAAEQAAEEQVAEEAVSAATKTTEIEEKSEEANTAKEEQKSE